MTSDNRTNGRTKPSEGSQTLARGLKLLDVIAEGREGVPVRDLAAAMGLPRSIVQRLLYTLEAEGFLERHPLQVGYRLAIKLWRLGCQSVRRLSVRDLARPHLEELAQRTNEMVKLAVLTGSDVVYIDGIESSQSIRAYVPIGGSAPAHSSATGKAILAFLPPAALDAILAPRLPRHTAATIADRAGFEAELAEVRRTGWAKNREEWRDGVCAAAVPLFDSARAVIASLSVTVPTPRFTQSALRAKLVPALKKTGAALTDEIARTRG
jgi:IclR family KDG regulon transcriptional repressor